MVGPLVDAVDEDGVGAAVDEVDEGGAPEVAVDATEEVVDPMVDPAVVVITVVGPVVVDATGNFFSQIPNIVPLFLLQSPSTQTPVCFAPTPTTMETHLWS